MTIVIRRPVGVLVGLAAAAAMLTACGSGPSQVGSALIVGDTSVSVSQVQQELNQLLATQPAVKQAQQQGKLDQTARSIVTTHVRHDLVARVAAQSRLSVTDQQVDQVINQAGGAAKLAPALGTTPNNVRATVKDLLLEVEYARKYADSLSVTAGYVEATTRADAVAKAQQIAADPNSLPAVVAAANKNAAQGQAAGAVSTQFTVQGFLVQVQQAQQQAQQQGQQAPPVNEGPLFGTPVNSVVIFQIAPQEEPTWVVALIKSRDTNSKSALPTGVSAADQSDLGTLQQIGLSLMQAESARAGVRISPRYGVWDPVDMQVTPSDDQSLGQVFPVKHALS